MTTTAVPNPALADYVYRHDGSQPALFSGQGFSPIRRVKIVGVRLRQGKKQ